MAETDIDIGVSVQDAAKDERCHRNGFLSRKTGEEIEVELFQVWVASRTINARGRGVNHQRHIQLHNVLVESIQLRVIEWPPDVGADVATQ